MWPWSWYIATTKSYWPLTARRKTVSPAWGPSALMPLARAVAMAGRMIYSSSRPKSPCSPAWGLSPQTAMRGSR